MGFHNIFEPNEKGRDYVVGDIHGMFIELDKQLYEVGFDAKRDRLFSVGDLTDRGPDSIKVLELLNEPWFHPVMGNHELMMLDVLNNRIEPKLWIANGGGWAYEPDVYLNLIGIKEKIEALPHAITVKHKTGYSFGICHAECPVDDWADIASVEHDAVVREAMVWGRTKIKQIPPAITKNISMTIHGHTPLKEIGIIGNAAFIDLGCFFSTKIAVICLDDFAKFFDEK